MADALVGLIMGSKSDWDTMQHAAQILEALGVPHETKVVSAHRTPDLLFEYAASAEARGIEVIIAGAGGAAHLPGMVELARDAFAVPVRAGTPEQGISGLVDSVQAPRYAVPVGLVLYAARRLAQGGVPSGSMVKSAGVERWFGPLKRWLQDFF